MAGSADAKQSSGDSETGITAARISDLVKGELRGDSDARVVRIAPLDRARDDELSFLASPKYAGDAERSNAAVILVAPDLATTTTRARATIVVEKPHDAVLAVLPQLYRAPERKPGIHQTARLLRGATIGNDVTIEEYAVIGADAVIGDRVWIGPHVVVGDGAAVGDDSALYSQCTIYNGARVGKRVIVHSGARIGSDGFGYVFRGGAHEKIPHVGRCIVGDDVEIGANTTIDRGSIDDTVIGDGTKIDNLVHVAHNVRIGRLCLLMAQVGIAGSVRIGDGAIIAGQAGISGHVNIGAGARLAAQAGVFGDVPAGETWSGYPARPHRESLRASGALFKLTRIIGKLERLVEDRDR